MYKLKNAFTKWMEIHMNITYCSDPKNATNASMYLLF